MSSQGAPRRRGWTKLIPIAIATCSLSIGAGLASGQSTSGGGTGMPTPPSPNRVECQWMCAGITSAGEGSVVRIQGHNLANVAWVAFKNSDGGRTRVAPNHVGANVVRAKVPAGAASGRVRVVDIAEQGAGTSNQLQIVAAEQLSDGGDFNLRTAEAAPRKGYFFATQPRRPAVRYIFGGESATTIRIQVVRIGNGRVVRTITQANREPNRVYTARWNGRRQNGKLAADGRFRFRIGSDRSARVQTTADARFRFYRHIFPVRGKPRGWGDGFGAGRGHQGQDIFVRCGTPLVAARGGTVRHNRWHGAAGWYVVISGRGTGRDYMYAHLQRKSPVRPGETVRTGQRIGRVGATGNASGCHLHFELWSAPGWYRGGRPLPGVTRQMRRWASWS